MPGPFQRLLNHKSKIFLSWRWKLYCDERKTSDCECILNLYRLDVLPFSIQHTTSHNLPAQHNTTHKQNSFTLNQMVVIIFSREKKTTFIGHHNAPTTYTLTLVSIAKIILITKSLHVILNKSQQRFSFVGWCVIWKKITSKVNPIRRS